MVNQNYPKSVCVYALVSIEQIDSVHCHFVYMCCVLAVVIDNFSNNKSSYKNWNSKLSLQPN